jgi:lysophospholipase L1-like esterase
MTFYNGGVSGSTMQGLSDRAGFSLANGRYTKLPDNIDYLLIWFGWNDNAYGTLGTIDDNTNASYYGGYNIVLPYLINKYPYAKIGLIVQFGSSAEHREAVRLLGNKWGCAVWDNYQGGTPLYFGKEDSVGVSPTIVTANKAKFQANGAHPNFKGHRQLADMIEEWLKGI